MSVVLRHFVRWGFLFVTVAAIVVATGIAYPVTLTVSPSESLRCQLSCGWAFGLFQGGKGNLICTNNDAPVGKATMLSTFLEQPIALLPGPDASRVICLYDFDVKAAVFTI